MAKFRFRLATLQRLRELHRDELRSKLAEAVKAQLILVEQMEQVDREAAELHQMRRHHAMSPTINVETLLEAQRYQGVLAVQKTTMTEQNRLLAAEIERRRQAVVEADQQVKILEKLYDRKLDEFQRQQLLGETKQLDEVAARRSEEAKSWQL